MRRHIHTTLRHPPASNLSPYLCLPTTSAASCRMIWVVVVLLLLVVFMHEPACKGLRLLQCGGVSGDGMGVGIVRPRGLETSWVGLGHKRRLLVTNNKYTFFLLRDLWLPMQRCCQAEGDLSIIDNPERYVPFVTNVHYCYA